MGDDWARRAFIPAFSRKGLAVAGFKIRGANCLHATRERRLRVGRRADAAPRPMKALSGTATGWRDVVPASAAGGYGSERPEGGLFGLSRAKMRHGLSRGLANLVTFNWEARGEHPRLRGFLCVKDAREPRDSRPP